jgi:drug/metabolite transporter (DMT)-like permease
MKSNFLLFLTAMIWGFAFVAQRKGMDYIGPFLFNGIRFTLGGVSLLPIYFFIRKKPKSSAINKKNGLTGLFLSAGTAGLFMFAGSGFQQIGVQYTTAGNAGFITGLYVVIVPVIGLFAKNKISRQTWLGVFLALLGMYLLSVKGNFDLQKGDVLVFVSAFFFAAHVHLLSVITRKYDALSISIIQFFVCAGINLIIAFIDEPFVPDLIFSAAIPILYAGIFSVGIAYTLQVIAQKEAEPAHAAIILSLESVFAVVGGMLFLSETMSMRGLLGCGLMLAGMILSQIKFRNSYKKSD